VRNSASAQTRKRANDVVIAASRIYHRNMFVVYSCALSCGCYIAHRAVVIHHANTTANTNLLATAPSIHQTHLNLNCGSLLWHAQYSSTSKYRHTTRRHLPHIKGVFPNQIAVLPRTLKYVQVSASSCAASSALSRSSRINARTKTRLATISLPTSEVFGLLVFLLGCVS
jgi:hypothetical protein